jgi:hypothetical protein
MALVVADRVKETTTTTGTGTYTLAGAVDGFQTFGAIGDGNTTYYACSDGTDYEVGIGTYTASGTTLARTTIIESSNSDAAVNWSAGSKQVFCTLPADKAIFADSSGIVAKPIRLEQQSLTASGGTLTIDLSAANNFKITMTAATTFAFSNKDAGRGGNIVIVENATGGYSFTLPSECKTPVNGASIVQSTGANEVSILSYYVVDSSNILVNYLGDFA